MASLNKVSLLGRVGKDPEIRNTQSGECIASFSIATGGDKYKDQQGNQQISDTQWHNCTAFKGLANVVANYVHKGTQIYIDGKIKYGKYTSKDGVEKTATKIIVDNLILLGSKNENTFANNTNNDLPTSLPNTLANTSQTNNQIHVETAPIDDVNDIPF